MAGSQIKRSRRGASGHPGCTGTLSRRAGAEYVMAKLFYTLDEAAARLKKSPDDIRAMVSSGQLQEFRDRDKLMFKVDQVNLLAAGGEDEGGVIPLAESGELNTISLASDSGTGMNLES